MDQGLVGPKPPMVIEPAKVMEPTKAMKPTNVKKPAKAMKPAKVARPPRNLGRGADRPAAPSTCSVLTNGIVR